MILSICTYAHAITNKPTCNFLKGVNITVLYCPHSMHTKRLVLNANLQITVSDCRTTTGQRENGAEAGVFLHKMSKRQELGSFFTQGYLLHNSTRQASVMPHFADL